MLNLRITLKTVKISVGALLLSTLIACSSTPKVFEHEVRTLSKLPAAPTASYRFERLLSQEATNSAQAPSSEEMTQRNQAQTQLEDLAQNALHKVGLNLAQNPQEASFSVQVNVRSQVYAQTYWDPWYGPGWYGRPRFGVSVGTGFGRGHMGVGWGIGFPIGGYDSTDRSSRYELTLLIRDLRTQTLVYESTAVSEFTHVQPQSLVQGLLEAALSDFPNASNGTKRVKVGQTLSENTAKPTTPKP